jgi:hypothetical protein
MYGFHVGPARRIKPQEPASFHGSIAPSVRSKWNGGGLYTTSPLTCAFGELLTYPE